MALKLLFLLIISTLITWLIKDMTHIVRPFAQEPQLYIMKVSGYSFPSGGVYAATTIYGYLAYISRKRIYYYLTICLICLIVYSRMALGVHFPFDVICGLFFGLVISSCFVSVETRLEQLGSILLKRRPILLIPYLLVLASSVLLFNNKLPILLIVVSSGVILGYYSIISIQNINNFMINCQKITTCLILNLIGLSIALVIFIY